MVLDINFFFLTLIFSFNEIYFFHFTTLYPLFFLIRYDFRALFQYICLPSFRILNKKNKLTKKQKYIVCVELTFSVKLVDSFIGRWRRGIYVCRNISQATLVQLLLCFLLFTWNYLVNCWNLAIHALDQSKIS